MLPICGAGAPTCGAAGGGGGPAEGEDPAEGGVGAAAGNVASEAACIGGAADDPAKEAAVTGTAAAPAAEVAGTCPGADVEVGIVPDPEAAKELAAGVGTGTAAVEPANDAAAEVPGAVPVAEAGTTAAGGDVANADARS